MGFYEVRHIAIDIWPKRNEYLSKEEAELALHAFSEKWDEQDPLISKSWQRRLVLVVRAIAIILIVFILASCAEITTLR